MFPKQISKLEIKTRQRVMAIEKAAQPGQLKTKEGRREVFKQFTTHNDPSMVAAKIRIIQKHTILAHRQPISIASQTIINAK